MTANKISRLLSRLLSTAVLSTALPSGANHAKQA